MRTPITLHKLDETGHEVCYYHGVVADPIITSDGEQIVVDEEEFAMLEISPEERQPALETLGHLQAMATIWGEPFSIPQRG